MIQNRSGLARDRVFFWVQKKQSGVLSGLYINSNRISDFKQLGVVEISDGILCGQDLNILL